MNKRSAKGSKGHLAWSCLMPSSILCAAMRPLVGSSTNTCLPSALSFGAKRVNSGLEPPTESVFLRDFAKAAVSSVVYTVVAGGHCDSTATPVVHWENLDLLRDSFVVKIAL
jgi:hypothetical protein